MPIKMTKAPAKPAKQRALLPDGPNFSRIVQVIDLGLQEQRPYQGQEKPPAYEIYLTFEFPNETIEVEGEERPMWKSRRIKLSSHEKSTCYKWYSKLDPQDKARGDWAKLVDTPCMTLITHSPGQGKNEGITFDNIADVMPPMKGVEVPPLENPTTVFDLTSPNLEVFESLPEWLQEIIKGNLEFDGSKLQRLLEGTPVHYTARAPGDAPEDQDSDDVSPDDVMNATADEESPWD